MKTIYRWIAVAPLVWITMASVANADGQGGTLELYIHNITSGEITAGAQAQGIVWAGDKDITTSLGGGGIAVPANNTGFNYGFDYDHTSPPLR